MAKLTPTSTINGNGDMKMPIIGLGTWQGTNDEMETAVDAALEAGYRHIDTAHIYGNEAGIGRALRKWFDSGKLKRDDVFIVTKCNPTHFRPEHIEKSIDESLEKLQVDYVDMFLAHMPFGWVYSEDGTFVRDADGQLILDMNTDLEANWKTMETLVDKGKTKAIGVSNFNKSQVKRILDVARIKPSNNQVELYVYLQQRELVEFCKENGVVVVAYGPIGSPGMVKMALSRGVKPEDMNIQSPMQDPVVLEIAKKHNKTAAQVLLRFLVQCGIVVIPKSSNAERVQENINIFDFELSPGEYNRLWALEKGEAGRQFGGTGLLKNATQHPEWPHPK